MKGAMEVVLVEQIYRQMLREAGKREARERRKEREKRAREEREERAREEREERARQWAMTPEELVEQARIEWEAKAWEAQKAAWERRKEREEREERARKAAWEHSRPRAEEFARACIFTRKEIARWTRRRLLRRVLIAAAVCLFVVFCVSSQAWAYSISKGVFPNSEARDVMRAGKMSARIQEDVRAKAQACGDDADCLVAVIEAGDSECLKLLDYGGQDADARRARMERCRAGVRGEEEEMNWLAVLMAVLMVGVGLYRLVKD